MSIAISFLILSYLALRLAQVLAEAFAVEEVFWEVVLVCFFEVVVFAVVVVGLVEVVMAGFVLTVCKEVFFVLAIGVVAVFDSVVGVVFGVVFVGLFCAALGLRVVDGLSDVFVVVGLIELVEAGLVGDEDVTATANFAWTVECVLVLVAKLELETLGSAELVDVVGTLEIDETEAAEDEVHLVANEEELEKDGADDVVAMIALVLDDGEEEEAINGLDKLAKEIRMSRAKSHTILTIRC